ncbi:MAG: acetamidase/formamidase family protein [Acidimicrobiales bacterium]
MTSAALVRPDGVDTSMAPFVGPTPDTVQWGAIDPAAAMIGPFALDEPLRVRTVQGDPGDNVADGWVAAEIEELHRATAPTGEGPHVLTGPIGFEGLVAGDVVAVHIDDVTLAAPYGFNRIRPGLGVLPGEVDELTEVIYPIDRDRRTALVHGIEVPLRPFPGIVATLPDPAGGPVTTKDPGPHGGNLDCTLLVEGSTLYLPVVVDGAGLCLGDGHGAQGDGEVDLTAIETCLDLTVRATLGPTLTVEVVAPYAVTPAGFVVMGLGATLDEALHAAVAQTVDLLAATTDLDRVACYRLLSVVGDCRITQAVSRLRGVHVVVPGPIAAQLPGRPAWLDHLEWTR